MKKILMMMWMSVAALASQAISTIDNDYYTLTAPDDSWIVQTDGTVLQSVGGRAMLHRNDARRHIMELARIDYLDGAFDPAEYLHEQVIEQRDVFCKNAIGFSEVQDTWFCGFNAKQVLFSKSSGGTTYQCAALVFNAGFTTFFIIKGHRSDMPDVVGTVLNSMTFHCDTTQLVTTADYVKAVSATLLRHRLPIGNNEMLTEVSQPDANTVELEILLPYVNHESVDVPMFVQTMRERWMKALPKQVKLNKFMATLVAEQKNLRYTYVDNNDYDIGTLLITPVEYNFVLQQAANKNE